MTRVLMVLGALLFALLATAAPARAQTYFPFGSVAIGTTSAVRVGPMGCATATADPTYTTAQIHPVSCTTDGRMRTHTTGNVTVEPGVTPIDAIIVSSATLNVAVTNGSASQTDDRNIPANVASVAQTASVQYGFNGTTNSGHWADPCETEDKTTTPFSITTDTVLITATSAKKNYVCSIVVVTSAAEIVSITEGTGTVCGTSEAAIVGSTTDANGMSFAANGGLALGNGAKTIFAGKTANVDTCFNVSGSNRTVGAVTWVQR